MSKFTAENEKTLLKMLGEELEAWQQIKTLTESQSKLLESDDIDALERSLDQRQGQIEKIGGLHQGGNILMQSYISQVNSKGVKSEKIEAEKEKLREMITACSTQNDKNMQTAAKLKTGYSEKAEELGQKRKSIGAYALEVPNNSEIFDKKM